MSTETRSIKNILKTIPVVVPTSSRETPDLIQFYKHGVDAYVVKPVDFSEFMAAVKKLGVFWAAVNEPPPHVERENFDSPWRSFFSRKEKG